MNTYDFDATKMSEYLTELEGLALSPKAAEQTSSPSSSPKADGQIENPSSSPKLDLPSDRDAAYISTYVSRKYDAYTKDCLLNGIAKMREYLASDASIDAKEFEFLIFFKHTGRWTERCCQDMDYLILQRYDPNRILEGHEDEDYDERYEREQYICDDGTTRAAPAVNDPVELDPQWADISEAVRRKALEAYSRALYSVGSVARDCEATIRYNQWMRQTLMSEAKRGVKKIAMRRDAHLYTREIPVGDPLPEGYYEIKY